MATYADGDGVRTGVVRCWWFWTITSYRVVFHPHAVWYSTVSRFCLAFQRIHSRSFRAETAAILEYYSKKVNHTRYMGD
jgi:hypothetical protein